MNTDLLLAPVHSFLHCRTPQAWIDEASKPENLPLLLTDHLVCELKAAQTAMWLIRKYVADKESGETLLTWLKPWEQFVHSETVSLEFLQQHKGLSKAIISRTDVEYGDLLVDKMVLLIKEELHHFWQVMEIMQARNIAYMKMTASRYAKGLLREVATYEPLTLWISSFAVRISRRDPANGLPVWPLIWMTSWRPFMFHYCVLKHVIIRIIWH